MIFTGLFGRNGWRCLRDRLANLRLRYLLRRGLHERLRRARDGFDRAQDLVSWWRLTQARRLMAAIRLIDWRLYCSLHQRALRYATLHIYRRLVHQWPACLLWENTIVQAARLRIRRHELTLQRIAVSRLRLGRTPDRRGLDDRRHLAHRTINDADARAIQPGRRTHA